MNGLSVEEVFRVLFILDKLRKSGISVLLDELIVSHMSELVE